jgi:hypothetical protein
MRSTAAFGRLEQFYLEPELDVGRAVQRPDAARPPFEKRTIETAVDLFRFGRARGLWIAAGRALAAVAAALDSILTTFALAPASV